jgi:hypothetical protein
LKNPADPVDPVIRVLFLFHNHHPITTPRSPYWTHLSTISPFHLSTPNRSTYIYGGLICKTWLAGGLPAVILNPVRDDLRMMAPNAVAAREGGMTEIEEGKQKLFEW